MQFPRLAAMAILTTALIVACGGSPAATTPGPGPTQTAAPSGTATPVSTAPVGTTPTPGGGGTVDVCSLLSPADLSAALGQQYLEGVPDQFGQCAWNIEGASGNTGFLVYGAIQPQQLGFIKSSFGAGGTDVTVSGHAGFYNPTEGLGSLWVDVGGGNLFVLSFPQSNDLDPSYRAIAQGLAEIALANL